jgi:redox-sensitive bicupin YhaK (pirin superfamily)
MIRIRRGEDRGHFDHGWLNTYHTFSFADYHDPEHMGYRVLRVINEDRVQPGRGFGTHPHRDMEIISYVLEGALEHKDSMGNGSIIRPGDVQRMSAGTGVLHSEFNPSQAEQVHFLQIWLFPDRKGLAPEYEQKRFSDDDKRGRMRLVASGSGKDGSVTIHQDADVYASLLDAASTLELSLRSGRHGWLHVARGRCQVGETELRAGDAAAIEEEPRIGVRTLDAPAEILFFDLP